MPSITVICRDSSVKNMICREIMNAFRPKQRQSMWLKYIFYVVSVCRRCTFSFNMTKTQRNQRKIWFFFLSICNVICIPWINFHKGSIHTVIRWYANFCQKVKRYQNHMQRNARSLQCYNIVKCFRELGNSKIWPNLYAMFFYNRQSESIAKALHVYRLLASPIY